MGITTSTEQKVDPSNAQQQGRGRSSSTTTTPPINSVNVTQNMNIKQYQQQQQQQQQQYQQQQQQHSQSYKQPPTNYSSSRNQPIPSQPSSSYPAKQSPVMTSQSINTSGGISNNSKQYSNQNTPRFIPMGNTPATSEFNVLMSPPSSPLVGSLGIPNTETVPTVFTWGGGGKEVFIAGSFNNWKEKIPLSHSEKDFTLIYNLPPGVHQYKFIVDGKWVHSSEQPVAADTKGNLINFVEVKPKDVSNDLTNFKIQSSSPPGSYTNSLPEEEFQKVPPPSLPPHLRRALLNTQPSTEDPTLLPLPHHVMLNHLYSLPRKDQVTILGVTHRYKTKFVTTVLYKPIHESSNDKNEPDDLN